MPVQRHRRGFRTRPTPRQRPQRQRSPDILTLDTHLRLQRIPPRSIHIQRQQQRGRRSLRLPPSRRNTRMPIPSLATLSLSPLVRISNNRRRFILITLHRSVQGLAILLRRRLRLNTWSPRSKARRINSLWQPDNSLITLLLREERQRTTMEVTHTHIRQQLLLVGS